MWRSKRIGVLVCTCSGMTRAGRALGVPAMSFCDRCRNIKKLTYPAVVDAVRRRRRGLFYGKRDTSIDRAVTERGDFPAILLLAICSTPRPLLVSHTRRRYSPGDDGHHGHRLFSPPF